MRGDYSNGRIYFIEPICEHEDNEVYYGSTLQKLCKRMDFHRGSYKTWKNGDSGKCMCYNLFEKYGLENCKIYLVELYPCKSREELESREGYYIRNYDCVNKLIPGRTKKEWRIDTEYDKIYYQSNKENLRVKIICSCGGRYSRDSKSKHFNTKKHNQYLEQQKNNET